MLKINTKTLRLFAGIGETWNKEAEREKPAEEIESSILSTSNILTFRKDFKFHSCTILIVHSFSNLARFGDTAV